MGNVYGDAKIDLLYDMDMEVKMTNPSEEVMRIHKIQPQKYLVLPKTDKKFPEGVFVGIDGIGWEPKTVVKPPKPGSYYPTYERINLEDAEIGSTYPVTLIQRIVDINSELEAMRIPRVDSSNELIFKPGELEERLFSSKKKFLAVLESCGLTSDENKVYFQLVGNFGRIY